MKKWILIPTILPIISSLVPTITLSSCSNSEEEKEFVYDEVYGAETLVNGKFERETGYYESPTLDPDDATSIYLDIISKNQNILVDDIIESISKLNIPANDIVGSGKVGITIDNIDTEQKLLSFTLGLNCNISGYTTDGDKIVFDFKNVEVKIVNLPCLVHPQGEQEKEPWRWDVSIHESRWTGETGEEIDWSISYSGATIISLNGLGIDVDRTITLNKEELDGLDEFIKETIIYMFVQYVFFKSWYLSNSQPVEDDNSW